MFTQVTAFLGRARRRVARWPRWRRLLIFVVAPLLLCCGSVAVAIPVLWVVNLTADAGRAANTPDAAANIYLMALSYGNEDGLVNVLANDRQDHLLAQWRKYRVAMKQTRPEPARLGWGSLAVAASSETTAHVSTDVTAAWEFNETGGAEFYKSAPKTWQFEARLEDGWQVTLVQAPRWCGDYAVPPACRE